MRILDKGLNLDHREFYLFFDIKVDNSKTKFTRRIIFQKKKVALLPYAILEKISHRKYPGSHSSM